MLHPSLGECMRASHVHILGSVWRSVEWRVFTTHSHYQHGSGWYVTVLVMYTAVSWSSPSLPLFAMVQEYGPGPEWFPRLAAGQFSLLSAVAYGADPRTPRGKRAMSKAARGFSGELICCFVIQRFARWLCLRVVLASKGAVQKFWRRLVDP